MEEIKKLFKNIFYRLEVLERGLVIKKITIPSDTSGFLIIKRVTTDPVAPIDGEMWINTTSKQLKWRNGATTQYVAFS